MRSVAICASAVLGILIASPGTAADLPARTAAPRPMYAAPIFTWTGLYVGVNAGYGFGGRDGVTTTGQAAANIANVAGGARPASVSLDRDGFVGGGQIGYNWQAGAFVYGVEADLSYMDIRDSRTITTTNLPGAAVGPSTPLLNAYKQELDYLGTVRARLGYAFGRSMVFATGGFAYGRVENGVNLFGPNVAPVNGALQFTGSRRKTETGYALGAGFEHMLTDALSIKAEYMYYNLGKTNVSSNVIVGSGGGGTGYNARFNNDGHIVRAGLNYKFSSFGF